MKDKVLGPLLIALGASLWATDALFRVPSLNQMEVSHLVTWEHFFATIALLPLAWFQRKAIAALSFKHWLGILWVGCLGSAIALVLFTKSFHTLNPSIAILLQKLQPLIAAFLAFLFLKERPHPLYFVLGPIAIFSAFTLSFPHLELKQLEITPSSIGNLYAVIAAFLWGSSTVVGKALLNDLSAQTTTFLRYLFGSFALMGFALQGGGLEIAQLKDFSTLQSILYMSFVPGLIAVFIYYQGLARTKASIATLVELVFPIAAVILNWIFLGQTLSMVQIFSAVVLLGCVSTLSILNAKIPSLKKAPETPAAPLADVEPSEPTYSADDSEPR